MYRILGRKKGTTEWLKDSKHKTYKEGRKELKAQKAKYPDIQFRLVKEK